MIKNQWYAILDSREVKPGKAVGVTRLGEKLVVWRTAGGELSVLADLCPHRGAAFSLGEVKSDCILCPFHGFEFDRSGRCQAVPANGRAGAVPKVMKVQNYPVREAHDFIWVWWGEPREQYPDVPFFDDLGPQTGFSYASDRDAWPVHYTRAVENQLDVFHLPFVHATTIGRGKRFIHDGPVYKLGQDRLEIWYGARPEDGRPARRADELAEPTGPALLRFIFPNIWMNNLGPDMRITVAFVPIDEENCVLYLRYYQRFVRLPLLRSLVNWLIMLSSRAILAQDKRVVITQQPIWTDLKMDEKLIPADAPIIAFRRRNRELKEAAAES